MTTRKIDLVTGGAGFIGSHLVDHLVHKGRNVRVLDNLSVGRLENIDQHIAEESIEFVHGDVSDPKIVLETMTEVDRVFHLAARADIVPSIEEPEVYFRSNVDGTFNVMQAARAADVSRVVYISSSSSYGLASEIPTTEHAEIQPQYPYALTKYLGEQIALHWGSVYKIPVNSLCFFNVYGPRVRTSGTYGAVFGVFLAQLLDGKPLTVVGDGNQTRDFTFVSDVVNAIVLAADGDEHGYRMNVGTGTPVSVNRLVELLGAKSVVRIPKRPGEPDVTHADSSLIHEKIDWQSKISIEEGVAIMLDNIEYWRDAPVWTPETIKVATADWFTYL